MIGNKRLFCVTKTSRHINQLPGRLTESISCANENEGLLHQESRMTALEPSITLFLSSNRHISSQTDAFIISHAVFVQ